MLPGPVKIYKCPKCDNLMSVNSLLSGNTFDSELYSDGKNIFPMLPEFPDLTICPKCKTIFWLSKTEKEGVYEWGEETNVKWKNADHAKFLTIKEYFLALEYLTDLTKEEELFIRERIWWAYNDRVRNRKELFESDGDDLTWQTNNLRLINLVNTGKDFDMIMTAELYRNMGNFEKSLEILNNINNPAHKELISLFMKECKLKNTKVFRLR